MCYKKFTFFPVVKCLVVFEYTVLQNKYFILRRTYFFTKSVHDVFYDKFGIKQELFINEKNEMKYKLFTPNKVVYFYERINVEPNGDTFTKEVFCSNFFINKFDEPILVTICVGYIQYGLYGERYESFIINGNRVAIAFDQNNNLVSCNFCYGYNLKHFVCFDTDLNSQINYCI